LLFDFWYLTFVRAKNVGIEINGKGAVFSRPVVVYRKLSSNGFMAIPMSTQQKEGSWYVSVFFRTVLSLVGSFVILPFQQCV
jgi:hypothetical protein